MPGWLIGLIYGTGYIVSARKFAVRFINNQDDITARLFALGTAIVWPFIALYCLIFWKLPETEIQRQRKIAALERENERLRRQIEEPDKTLSPWRPAELYWAERNKVNNYVCEGTDHTHTLAEIYKMRIAYEKQMHERMRAWYGVD